LLFICFSIACKHEKVEEVDKEVLELANKGDMNAQYVLGCYYYDQGEIEKAILWWKKSAEQGNTEAQSSLGDSFYEEDHTCTRPASGNLLRILRQDSQWWR